MKLHKHFLTFSFTLLLLENIFAQAAVDIPLSATIETFTYQLAVGLDLNATNGIDESLGEYILPPPTPWVFVIAFDLYPYTGDLYWTFKDYRAPGNPPSFPFTGMIEHTLAWDWTDSPIIITYNLPVGTIMWITDNITGTLLNLGPFIGQGVVTIPESYTAFGNRALLKMDYDNIVPVELTSFTASVLQNEKVVQLNWTTATETNNSGFEILRFAQNDNEWNTIGYVPGFGTTTEPKSYSFIDENVSTGVYKYRLKQIDFDGSFEFSNEIEVEVDFTPKEFVLYQNYPNPFNPNTTIKYEIPNVETHRDASLQMVTLRVYDILGNEVATLVNEERQAGVYEVEFNSHSDEGQNLTSGVYFYQLSVRGPETSSGQKIIQTKKMILTK